MAGCWIDANVVRLGHWRGADATNRIDTWARHPDGNYGRGVQYPFMHLKSGAYVAAWDATKLEPWKQMLRALLVCSATYDETTRGHISCEYIPLPDYGADHKYSVFDNNVACARWIRGDSKK